MTSNDKQDWVLAPIFGDLSCGQDTTQVTKGLWCKLLYSSSFKIGIIIFWYFIYLFMYCAMLTQHSLEITLQFDLKLLVVLWFTGFFFSVFKSILSKFILFIYLFFLKEMHIYYPHTNDRQLNFFFIWNFLPL